MIGTGGWRHRPGKRFSLAKSLVVIFAVGALLAAVVVVVGGSGKKAAAGAGEWKPIAAPLKGVLPRDARPMVQLPDPDGRIFTGNELYDPKTKPDGSWAKAARTLGWSIYHHHEPAQVGQGEQLATMVAIKGDDKLCKPNCGKVLALVLVRGTGCCPAYNRNESRWELFDPKGKSPDTFEFDGTPEPRVGSWALAGRSSGSEQPRLGNERARAVQIMGNECGSNCGKVLIISENVAGSEVAPIEFWDPKTDSFTTVVGPKEQAQQEQSQTVPTQTESEGRRIRQPLLQILPTGQVLIVNGECAGPGGIGLAEPEARRMGYVDECKKDAAAWIFYPLTTRIVPVAAPEWRHHPWADEVELLTGGKVIVTSNWATHVRWTEWNTGGRNGPEPGPVDIGVFTPPPSEGAGAGSWGTTPGCGDAKPDPSAIISYEGPGNHHVYNDDTNLEDQMRRFSYYEKYCHLLSPLPKGKVLAWTSSYMEFSSSGYRSHSYQGRTYVLEEGRWKRTGDLKNKEPRFDHPNDRSGAWSTGDNMPSGGILIGGDACHPNCNKVLAVSHSTQFSKPPVQGQLYTPDG